MFPGSRGSTFSRIIEDIITLTCPSLIPEQGEGSQKRDQNSHQLYQSAADNEMPFVYAMNVD